MWAVDHLYWPRPMLECLTVLTVAACNTTGAAVGSCVLQLPLRRPAAVAKQAATLQALTGGRFVLGVGIGSHPGEYAACGEPFEGRGTALNRAIDGVRAAWGTGAGDVPSHYRQLPAPAPVPIWIGGSSPAARRRAARTGDGWIPMFMDADDYGAQLDLLWHDAEAAGRSPDQLVPAVVVFVHVGRRGEAADEARRRGCRWLSSLYALPPKAFARHLVCGSAAHCAAQVDRYRRAGAHHVAVMVAGDRAAEQFCDLAEALGLGGPPGRGAALSQVPQGQRRQLVEV